MRTLTLNTENTGAQMIDKVRVVYLHSLPIGRVAAYRKCVNCIYSLWTSSLSSPVEMKEEAEK